MNKRPLPEGGIPGHKAITLRLSPELKAAALEAAQKDGIPALASWIKATMRARIEVLNAPPPSAEQQIVARGVAGLEDAIHKAYEIGFKLGESRRNEGDAEQVLEQTPGDGA